VDIEYTLAKGHQQQKFPATVTVYIQTVVPANSLLTHMVSEVSDADALLSSSIEPDTVVKVRIFRDASHVNDTYPDAIHAWQSDLHYQSARIGTRHKSPNFFNP
jgi:uncharacterized protein YqiB (DUF1249 family)